MLFHVARLYYNRRMIDPPSPAAAAAELRPRLLWLTENYHPARGGMAESCDRIVAGLRGLGTIVDVLHFTRHLEEPRVELKEHGRYIGYPLGDDPTHGLNCVWNMLERDPLSASYTHVVAFGGVVPMVAGPLMAAWLGLPLVTLFRGNDFDTGIFSLKRSDAVRFAIERSAAVCSVSSDKQRRIGALFPHVRSEWIPNGIDLDRWEALPSDRAHAERWRAEHVEPGRRVLGLVGHLKLKKGGPFFLETLLVSGNAARFHLLLVGDLDEEFAQFLDANSDTLAFTQYPFADRYELLRRYPACDMVVIPSFYDGLPNVLLEAAALGIPFVASTAGGMGDLLEDERHGYLFAPGEEHGCRLAIERAGTASDDDVRAMGEACRDLARRYDHHREARAYRDLFASIGRASSIESATHSTTF